MASSINFARELMTRTVHIKMYPTPRTFSHRREVLRVLERFGEVTMFRSHKYSPTTPVQNAFLCMFSDPSSATRAINSSPIRYTIFPPTEGNSEAPNSDPAHPQEGIPFQIFATPSIFDHPLYLHSNITNPLHQPFRPISPKDSFIAACLDRVIPPSMWSAGLRDWDTEKIALQDIDLLDREELGEQNGEKGRQYFIEFRMALKAQKNMPEAMKGLKGLLAKREMGRWPNAGTPS